MAKKQHWCSEKDAQVTTHNVGPINIEKDAQETGLAQKKDAQTALVQRKICQRNVPHREKNKYKNWPTQRDK